MMMLWHLVDGHGDIAVCMMVPTPEGKGMGSAPWPPAGQDPAFGPADSARSGSGSALTIPPLGSSPTGLGLRLCKQPGSRWKTVPHPAPSLSPSLGGRFDHAKRGLEAAEAAAGRGKAAREPLGRCKSLLLIPSHPGPTLLQFPAAARNPVYSPFEPTSRPSDNSE